MLILLDTASIKEIKELSDFYPVDGVTTNPSIVVKEKRDFMELMKDMLSVLGPEKMLHIQVVGLTTELPLKNAILNLIPFSLDLDNLIFIHLFSHSLPFFSRFGP